MHSCDSEGLGRKNWGVNTGLHGGESGKGGVEWLLDGGNEHRCPASGLRGGAGAYPATA